VIRKKGNVVQASLFSANSKGACEFALARRELAA
jgi:hypothetical protein